MTVSDFLCVRPYSAFVCQRLLFLLSTLFFKFEADVHSMSLADDGVGDPVTHLMGCDDGGQIIEGCDLFAVHGEDLIAGLETGLLRVLAVDAVDIHAGGASAEEGIKGVQLIAS